MSEFQQAMLLRIRCEIEEVVSKREAMVAENQARVAMHLPPRFGLCAFEENAAHFRAIAPDPHGFA